MSLLICLSVYILTMTVRLGPGKGGYSLFRLFWFRSFLMTFLKWSFPAFPASPAQPSGADATLALGSQRASTLAFDQSRRGCGHHSYLLASTRDNHATNRLGQGSTRARNKTPDFKMRVNTQAPGTRVPQPGKVVWRWHKARGPGIAPMPLLVSGCQGHLGCHDHVLSTILHWAQPT